MNGLVDNIKGLTCDRGGDLAKVAPFPQLPLNEELKR